MDLGHHAAIVGDIVVGSLLTSGLRMVAVKGVLEPFAAWAGRAAWRQADQAMGGRLPDLPDDRSRATLER